MHAISCCTFFVFAVYLLVLYVCAQIRIWSCLVTDNDIVITGLFTEIAVCKFLHGLARNLFILSIVCVYTFFCIFLYGALCPRFC